MQLAVSIYITTMEHHYNKDIRTRKIILLCQVSFNFKGNKP